MIEIRFAGPASGEDFRRKVNRFKGRSLNAAALLFNRPDSRRDESRGPFQQKGPTVSQRFGGGLLPAIVFSHS